MSKMSLTKAYKDKVVLVTGHTGFKGAWLSQWLTLLGADVYGYALEPETQFGCFGLMHLKDKLHHQVADIRDMELLVKSVGKIKPHIIFHLAAQSLVSESYRIPVETVQTNTMGTLHLLEAVRHNNLPAAVIAVTSDKCYENREWLYGYRENDPLGGYDPYASSKAAAEILIASWRDSFFNPLRIEKHGVKLASVRAGNVMGGGDWNKNHIVPDCIRALYVNETVRVRNPHATRPWQHVLEALGGYLLLGSKLLGIDHSISAGYCEAFNFGPLAGSNRSVRHLVEEIIRNWGNGSWEWADARNTFHESAMLGLSIDKACHKLDWLPRWNFAETVQHTVEWYRVFREDRDHIEYFTMEQIRDYQRLLDMDTKEPAVAFKEEFIPQY